MDKPLSVEIKGRFTIKIHDTEIEVRTSLLPGGYGESVVLRVLNPNAISVSLDELGIDKRLLDIIMHELQKPNGMILNTGPTGSGKTTTLYAFLKKIHTPGIKIITIENPIEYHLPGIVQTQTDDEKGYTFLEGLRSALRQDPDVIMVGEIRDDETAEIAVNAALTGQAPTIMFLMKSLCPGASMMVYPLTAVLKGLRVQLMVIPLSCSSLVVSIM
jgi:type II secretory ATPase GspE/PulE/Tfp pilus assembly ATPase PilB-like protein